MIGTIESEVPMSCVYEIWIGDYFYQGSTNNINKRIRDHKNNLKKGKHSNAKMQAVWNKYQSFEHQILVECDEVAVRIYEQDYIDANWGDPKYLNLAEKVGLLPDNKGRKFSDEHRAKLSAAAKGHSRTKGIPQSEEHKRKKAEARKGSVVSDETKAKISASLKARRKK